MAGISAQITKSSRVMNDDIVCLILAQLSVKQVLQLERVSQQFSECVKDVLRRQNVLQIGNNRCKPFYHCGHKSHGSSPIRHCDISDAIVCVRNRWVNDGYDLMASHQQLIPLFRKMSAICCLAISDCIISNTMVKWLSKMLPNLKCLRIGCCDEQIGVNRVFGKYFGKRLIHLYINDEHIDGQLSHYVSLKQLSIHCIYSMHTFLTFFDSNHDFDQTIYLCLTDVTNSDTDLLVSSDSVKSIVKLNIINYVDNVCANNLCQTLTNLRSLTCEYLSLESLHHLNHLKKLTHLKCGILLSGENQLQHCSRLTKVILPIVRSLRIKIMLNPQIVANILKMFPNLRKFSFDISVMKVCDHLLVDHCLLCVMPCLQAMCSLEMLTELRVTCESINFVSCLCNSLTQFKKLCRISIHCETINCGVTKVLMNSVFAFATLNRYRSITFEINDIFIGSIDRDLVPRNLLINNIMF